MTESNARTTNATARLVGLVAGCGALAALLGLGIDRLAVDLEPHVLLAGIVGVAALCWIAEAWPLTIEYRGESPAFTLVGVPLALGLVLLGPVPTLAARLLGTAAALVVTFRQGGMKLLVNLASFTLEVMVGAVVLQSLVTADGFANEPRGWVAVGVAVLVGDLATSVVVLAAIRLTVGPLSEEALRGFAVGSAVNSTIVIPMAVLAVLTLSVDLRTAVLLVPFAVLLGRTNRQRHLLGERFASVQRLYGFISDLSRTSGTADVIARVLAQAKAVSGATRARLLVVDDTGAVLWRLGAGDRPDAEPVPLHAALALLDAADQGRLLDEGEGVHPAADTLLPEAHEQILIGRFANADLRGALLLADRAGNLTRFGESDRQLVNALAGHAGTALGSSTLLDRVQAESERRTRMALRDGPTGMLNRNGLIDDRPALPQGAVVLVGIRDLAAFGTGFGHDVAEAVAADVGHGLRRAAALVDGDDVAVARVGASTFAVAFGRPCDRAEAEDLARRLAEAVSGPVTRGGLVINVMVRVGVALAPVHGTDVRELLRAADRALAEAEEHGLAIGWFESSRDRETTRRLELASELRVAIDEGQLAVAYQPKVDLQTGRVVGVEALARWPHAERGYISPVEFVDIAERTGLIRPLTLWVLGEATGQVREWREQGLDITVAVNISNAALRDGDAAWEVVHAVRDAGLPPSAVVLEITESELLRQGTANGGALSVFASAGLTVSIDDFGTGWSSLAQLKTLEVQELKIDRAFISDLTTDRRDRALCAAITTMARELGLRVVGEGIEDAGAAEVLRELGCTVGQGYHFARPVPADQLPAQVAEVEAMATGSLSRLHDRRRDGS